MKVSKNVFYFFIVFLLIAVIYAPVPQKVYALTNACADSSGAPIPCPDTGGNSGGSNRPGPKNRPTPVTTIPTSVPKLLAMPTAPAAAVLIPAGGAGLSNPNSELPAIQNPGQGSSPSNLPGLLGSIIAVLLILGGLFFGVLLPAIQKRSPNDGSDKMGAQPHMNDGADQFLKFEGNPSSQFDKASNQFLKLDGDSSNQFLKFEGSDKMGAQPHMDDGSAYGHDISVKPGSAPETVPGTPIKPPSPNIGDKSDGGTL